MINNTAFARRIINWHHHYGRHDLPWQHHPTTYRVWISEIMLQQTQVKTVIPYYQTFMARFPTIETLATATLDEVLTYWSGLGYYARARNLYQCAQIIHREHQGQFPDSITALTCLPGIGQSTAGAILSFAKQQATAILDGNVKRILCRVHAVEGWPGHSKTLQVLWSLAQQYTPIRKTAIYNQALMDLGSMICTRSKPDCAKCPVQKLCQAYLLGQQHLYPYPKPPKVIPTKNTLMLLLINQHHEILLEKRPPTGIWGGLWSLPQCELNTNIKDFINSRFNLNIKTTTKLPSFTHQFSHFRLDIEPRIIHTLPGNTAKIMEQSSIIWYNNQHNLSIGLAKPVKDLLMQVFMQGACYANDILSKTKKRGRRLRRTPVSG